MKKYFLVILSFIASSLLSPQIAAAASVDPCSENGSRPIWCGPSVSFGVILGSVIQFIFIIAVILALAFIIYGGIRWITSGGDKGGVETARNTIISAIIGLIVVVLAYFVINNLVLPFLGIEGFGQIRVPTIFGGDSTNENVLPACTTDNAIIGNVTDPSIKQCDCAAASGSEYQLGNDIHCNIP